MSLKVILGTCSVLTKRLQGKSCGYLLFPLAWLSSIAFVETEAEDLIRKGRAAQHDNWCVESSFLRPRTWVMLVLPT